MTTSNQEVMDAAQAFAVLHVRECCSELVAWRATGILPDGRVRELARLLQPVTTTHSLMIAEKLVTNEATRLISIDPSL